MALTDTSDWHDVPSWRRVDRRLSASTLAALERWVSRVETSGQTALRLEDAAGRLALLVPAAAIDPSPGGGTTVVLLAGGGDLTSLAERLARRVRASTEGLWVALADGWQDAPPSGLGRLRAVGPVQLSGRPLRLYQTLDAAPAAATIRPMDQRIPEGSDALRRRAEDFRRRRS